MSKFLCGIKKMTSSNDVVHKWVPSYDPADMLLPSTEFVALTVLSVDTVRGALRRLYPPGPEGTQDRLRIAYGGQSAEVVTRVSYLLPSKYEGITRFALKVTAGKDEPVLLDCGYEANRVLKRAYDESDYQTAPIVLRQVDDQYVEAKPDPKAANVRIGRRKAAVARQQKKAAEREANSKKEQERSEMRHKVWNMESAITIATVAVFHDVPMLRAVGTVSLYRLSVTREPTPDDSSRNRTRSEACQLRAAVRLHKRLARGRDWTALSEVRAMAGKVAAVAEAGLFENEAFVHTHPDDLEDVKWVRAVSARTLRRLKAAAEQKDEPNSKVKE